MVKYTSKNRKISKKYKELDDRGPHVEPICQSIYKYSLLPLSVTFIVDSHLFKCDTPYHQIENFNLLNMKIR